MITEKRDIRNIIIGFLIVLIIVLAGSLIYIVFIKDSDNNKNDNTDKPVNTPMPTVTPMVTPEATVTPEPSDKPKTSPIPTVTPVVTPAATPVEGFVYSERNNGLASYGVVTVKGYVEVKNKVLDCGVLGKCSEKEAVSVNDIAYLHITDSDNEEFKQALKDLGYEKDPIAIGCIKNGVISYRTAADEYGPSEYEGEEEDAYKYYATDSTFDKELTKKLTNSSSKKPITLKISKSKLTHYVSLTGQCDSVITNIEVVN